MIDFGAIKKVSGMLSEGDSGIAIVDNEGQTRRVMLSQCVEAFNKDPECKPLAKIGGSDTATVLLGKVLDAMTELSKPQFAALIVAQMCGFSQKLHVNTAGYRLVPSDASNFSDWVNTTYQSTLDKPDGRGRKGNSEVTPLDF